MKVRGGRSVHATIRPGLQRAAINALGGRLGGVAVVRPRDGAVLALAGLAVSAPQPPGSTFKIVTLSAALTHHKATPSSVYPVQTQAILSGVPLRNAGGEACGGSLVSSFVNSCNSVFAPLGARVGARRLVAMAEAYGFNSTPKVPAAKPSSISKPRDLKDSLAVGATAIGQDKDLATPLQMAVVGATVGARGRRAEPRIVRAEPVHHRRVISSHVAGEVRDMMIGVVRSGTGTAAAVPGVEVAGKTGTAELRPNSSDPRDADAWFVAFAPAGKPKVAVGVMLVGAGSAGRPRRPSRGRCSRPRCSPGGTSGHRCVNHPWPGWGRCLPSSAMPRRDQRILVALAFLSMAIVVVQSMLGLHPDLLLAVPALVLFLPLACGRYVGEDGIARLAAVRRGPVLRALARHTRRCAPRGSCRAAGV